MHQAWHAEDARNRRRGSDSPASSHDLSVPRGAYEAEEDAEESILTLIPSAASPQHVSINEITLPRAAKPMPRLIRADRTSSIIASTSQQRDPFPVQPTKPRPAKGAALIRAPSGKPPGKPAIAGRNELREQIHHIRQSKIVSKVVKSRDASCFIRPSDTRGRRVSDLEERVRQLECDKTAADRRLEDTEKELAAARAECETLKKENFMFQDYRRVAEEQKAKVKNLEEGVKMLGQHLDGASGKLERQNQTIKEQMLQLNGQREELSKQQQELEKRQGEVNELQALLTWVANEFENSLRRGNTIQPQANNQQDTTFEKMRQDVGEILRRLPPSPQAGNTLGEGTLGPHGNNTQSFASSSILPVGTAVITSHLVSIDN